MYTDFGNGVDSPTRGLRQRAKNADGWTVQDAFPLSPCGVACGRGRLPVGRKSRAAERGSKRFLFISSLLVTVAEPDFNAPLIPMPGFRALMEPTSGRPGSGGRIGLGRSWTLPGDRRRAGLSAPRMARCCRPWWYEAEPDDARPARAHGVRQRYAHELEAIPVCVRKHEDRAHLKRCRAEACAGARYFSILSRTLSVARAAIRARQPRRPGGASRDGRPIARPRRAGWSEFEDRRGFHHLPGSRLTRRFKRCGSGAACRHMRFALAAPIVTRGSAAPSEAIRRERSRKLRCGSDPAY